MKIEQIESLLIGNGYVVRITTDTGLTGIGQTACWGYPTAVQSIVDVFKDYLIGQNPLRIEHHWQHLYRMAPFRGTAIMGAVSAVDIALWDIKGKHFEVPVWELLGGNVRDKIRLHLLSGGRTPEDNFKAAQAAVAEGFTAIKFDPITTDCHDKGQARMIQTAVELTAAAREAGGPDLDLIIELHRKLTPMVSLALAEALKPFDPDRQHLSPSPHRAKIHRALWQRRALRVYMGVPRVVGTGRPPVFAAGCGLGRRHLALQKNRRHRRSLPLRGSDPQLPRTADYRRRPAPRRLNSQLYYPRVHQRRRSPAQRGLSVRV
ncbi:MAG: hypothetical protein J4F35_14310 [Candidatus Latescibacteria bacterium]|nr:hypothetical protein [Candidatus Latescibacterota bacterium]